MPVYAYFLKSGAKRYYFITRDSSGKQIKKSGFKRQSDAKKEEERFNVLHKNSKNAYFEDYFLHSYLPYLIDVRKYKITYTDSVKATFKRFERFYKMKLSDCTPAVLNKFFIDIAKNHSEYYCLMCYKRLHAFFAYIERTLDLPNPLRNLESPRCTTHKKKVLWSVDEFHRALEILDNSRRKIHKTYALLFRILYLCGLRSSEALALTSQDVVCEDNIYKIKINKVYNSEHDFIVYSTKTDKDREVFISQDLFYNIKTYVRENRISANERIINKTRKAALFFLTYFCKKYNLTRINLHSMRTAHATFLIENNINPSAAAERLGHSKKVMFQHYVEAHQNNEEITNLLKKIE